MPQSQRDNDFAKFAEAHKITLRSYPIGTRSNAHGFSNDDEWNQTAIHSFVTLLMGDREIWKGEYSRGFGCAESWARDPRRKEWKRSRNPETNNLEFGWWPCSYPVRSITRWKPLPYGKRYRPDAEPLQRLRALYATKCPPDVADVLEHLQMEIAGSDQPFADWASELGYSADSISAKAMWEACNDIRRAFQSAMTAEQFAAFMECEG